MKCDDCGQELQIGDWPFCGGLGNVHEKPAKTKGFEPYFCDQLGEYITGAGDRNKLLKPHWKDDHIVHIQPKDRPAGYCAELRDRRAAKREESLRNR